MTYRQLASMILFEMSDEQQDCDATVYVSGVDEAYSVTNCLSVDNGEKIVDTLGGILDDDHPYLVI